MSEETSQKTAAVRKSRVGKVVSDSSDKTIVVRIERRVPHPLFGKIIRRSKNFKAHDENNEAKVGDQVSIVEIAPLSRSKRWRLEQVLKH
ncbi:MAG: 30S ribosomal protein S17 [Chthoniobacterales bacterium]